MNGDDSRKFKSLQRVLVEAGKLPAPTPEEISAHGKAGENLVMIRAGARGAALSRRLARTGISRVRGMEALSRVTDQAELFRQLVELRPKPPEPEKNRFGGWR